ncbi:GDSL-type esterase/lipase family protein [Aliikangiella maris]|uniref:GDSL-type esterase/lipase family protein n=2 Tax=Aliikangiella maris TaxID=3162458 RepID=A0ABV3MTA5_9GAMM
MLEYHKSLELNTPSESILYFGDSHIQGLLVQAINPASVNFGIGTDTTEGLLRRLPTYKSIKNAKAIVILIGANDLDYRDAQQVIANYQKIVYLLKQQIGEETPLIFNGIFPVDESISNETGRNERALFINRWLENYARTNAGVYFVDIYDKLIDERNSLNFNYHVGDGVHLNSRANAIWIEVLKQKLILLGN